MKHRTNVRILAAIAVVSLSCGAYAQSSSTILPSAETAKLTLFENVEATNARPDRDSRPSREARVTTSEPEFTLLGIARIGEGHSAMLRHKSGETLLMKAAAGENTRISNYTEFSIVDISSRSVSIQYPQNNACVEFSEKGVRCNGAGNIAELTLANGEPIKAVISNDVESNEPTEELISNPANPFEALRDAQNARVVSGQDGNPTGGRFTPRRIDPADVPEGMRIIATPFGDRLVEE